jgi:tRNA wybutosine-synthesizing protein 2
VDQPAGRKSWLAVRHVNLGLLPTSKMSWDDAADILDGQRGGWVHVHENVDVREMEQKKDAVVQHFRAYLGGRMAAYCSHVEQVKTYAPGVMHCVFDMHIAPLPASRVANENG